MNVCWLHGLYDGIIYVYNNGMLDYVSPAEELLGVLAGAMAAPGEGEGGLAQSQIDLGNKILVYVSCCLAGRAYPYGEVPPDRKAKVNNNNNIIAIYFIDFQGNKVRVCQHVNFVIPQKR